MYNGNTYTSSTVKNDTLKTSLGCDSVYNVVNITVVPTAVITSITSNSPVAVGDTIKLFVNATNATNYSWQGVSGFSSISQNPFILNANISNAGWYYVTISNGCSSKTDSINIIVNANTYTITGRIISPLNKLINNATISLSSTANATTTSIAGVYGFNNLSTGSYTIKPKKNNDILKANGVKSLDVVLVQRHILNTAKLTGAYKLIAADVTNDKNINSADVIRIKRLVLGLDTTFTGNRLWAFVDSAYQFADTTNPFPYKDSISFTSLNLNKTNQTFIGIKLGDVNFDWDASLAKHSTAISQQSNALELIAKIASPISNSRLQIPITVNNFKDLTAFQYTLHFDNSKYEFVNIEGFNNLQGLEWNATKANETGSIAMLWTNATGEEMSLKDGTLLFNLVLRSIVNSKPTTHPKLTLTNDITTIAAWDKDFNQHHILLKIDNKEQEIFKEELFTVTPNPTSGIVKLNVLCKSTKAITFELSNIYGTTLLQQGFAATKGSNTFTFNLKANKQLPTGIYLLKAIGLEGEQLKRIIVE